MAQRGVNKAIILGNLGQDPDIRTSPNASVVANISVATSEVWKDQQGEKQERTEWHRVVMFGKTAEIAQKYLNKGSKIYLEGRLQTRKWTDKDGIARYSTEIVADTFQMLDGKSGGDGRDAKAAQQADVYYQSRPQQQEMPSADFDDDIPF